MKNTVLILLVFLLAARSEAQTRPTKMVREVRVLLPGIIPLPDFRTVGGQMVEMEPPAEVLAPVKCVFTESDAQESPDNETSAMLTLNRMTKLPSIKTGAKLRLGLANRAGSVTASVECEIGNMQKPVIIICRNHGREGWLKPVVKVVDGQMAAAPAGHAIFVNMTPIEFRFGVGKRGLPVPGNKVVKLSLETGDGVVPLRADAVAGQTSKTVLSTSLRSSKNARLWVVAVPNPEDASLPLAVRTYIESSAN